MSVDSEKYCARQNVVFEHGFFFGKLGRDHVCELVKGDVETPRDYSGVVYVPMDNAGAWKISLVKNMKATGLPVDMSKFICSLEASGNQTHSIRIISFFNA